MTITQGDSDYLRDDRQTDSMIGLRQLQISHLFTLENKRRNMLKQILAVIFEFNKWVPVSLFNIISEICFHS